MQHRRFAKFVSQPAGLEVPQDSEGGVNLGATMGACCLLKNVLIVIFQNFTDVFR